MARDIKKIKKLMTDEFMASEEIRQRYGLSETDLFESKFSMVSVESILFGIAASAIYVLEALFDVFRENVDKKMATAVVASIPWYHKIAMAYQHGDALVFNETTMQYGYETLNPDNQLVKFAACRDNGGYVYVLVAGEDSEGRPTHLSNDVLIPFRQYMDALKPAGIPVEVFSSDPDMIRLMIRVEYDPLLLNSNGSMVSDTSIYPVEEAVTQYLYGIEYGGVFNKTKLVDAIQNVNGVKDVVVDDVLVKRAAEVDYNPVAGNKYTSSGGSFAPDDLRNTISYVLQV